MSFLLAEGLQKLVIDGKKHESVTCDQVIGNELQAKISYRHIGRR